MKHEVPSALYLCRVAPKRVRSSTNNQAKRGRSLRGRWKTKRRLNHSRLRLTVIVVVRLVGCVCVVLIVALEIEEGDGGGREKRSEVQSEACSWIMNVKVSLKYPCCAEADTLHVRATEFANSCVDRGAAQRLTNSLREAHLREARFSWVTSDARNISWLHIPNRFHWGYY